MRTSLAGRGQGCGRAELFFLLTLAGIPRHRPAKSTSVSCGDKAPALSWNPPKTEPSAPARGSNAPAASMGKAGALPPQGVCRGDKAPALSWNPGEASPQRRLVGLNLLWVRWAKLELCPH